MANKNEKLKRWKEEHRDAVNAYSRKYYRDNKDRFKKWHRDWYEANKDQYLADRKEYQKQWNAATKRLVIDHYGSKCVCCGEADIGFLTIDHINGCGVQHRKEVGGGITFYRWLIRNDFPSGFQVLCFNCNCGRQANGGICPHKARK